MKEQIKAPEKIQLSKEERANLLDAHFKTLVIRMLTELVEYGHKLDEKMKAMLSEIKEEVKAIQNEIKKNIQRTNSEGRENRTQINYLEQRKK